MENSCPSTPRSETQMISYSNTSDSNSNGDGEGRADNFCATPQRPLHSQHQEQQEPFPPEVPLTPLALYPRQPRDESEARESFIRGAIDKAHEISALSWLEHIQNHDVHRFRSSIQRRPRSNSVPEQTFRNASQSLVPPPTIHEADRSFHSVTARSTLRKRRTSSHGDLGIAFPSTTSAVASASASATTTPSLAPSIAPFKHSATIECERIHNSRDIEIVASPTSFETDSKLQSSDFFAAPPPSIRETTNKIEESAPTRKNRIEGLATWEKHCNRHVQLMISLAFFSYLGQFSRYFIEHIFGKACHQPQLVGWDPKWSTCTSSPGTTESMGGAFFTDLPTNIIGCFLMGLLVSGDGESISVNLPMAGLPRNHFFQNWVVTHVGLRTGFCGALTTFASWNTQMVVMICGGSKATSLGYSQWMSAIWGYIVGFYASLQSYEFGVALAYALSRWYNPHLAKEADRIVDKKAIGVLIHRDLPDFERRFLHNIVLESQHNPDDDNNDEHLQKFGESSYESFYDDHIHHLRAWKETTENHRNGLRGTFENSRRSYVTDLHEIERKILVHRMEPRQELLDIARDAGWDVGALRKWASALTREEQRVQLEKRKKSEIFKTITSGERKTEIKSESENSVGETRLEESYFASSYSSLAEVAITIFCFLVTTGLLLTGFFHYSKILESNDDEATRVVAANYRAQFLSSLVSPLGTYTRWHLSRLNGTLHNEKWEWLPIGTLWANLIASCISTVCAGVLLSLEDDSLVTAFVVAIQVGFAGSCSTVSTFCTEIAGLMRALPRAFWGYYYGFGSMVLAAALGVVSYVWAVL